MKIAKKFIVKGYVQGVGYRYFTINTANRLGIYGYVEVYVIGTKEQMDEFKKYLQIGLSHAQVEEVLEEMSIVDNYISTFSVE